jgi:hypothetical protein
VPWWTINGMTVTVAGRHWEHVVETENLPAGADWTHHPRGAFRRQGDWFVDVTTGRKPDYPWRTYRLTLTPAVDAGWPAKVGGDTYRHAPEGATDLGEFATWALAIKAGNRALKARAREPLGLPWVGRADW